MYQQNENILARFTRFTRIVRSILEASLPLAYHDFHEHVSNVFLAAGLLGIVALTIGAAKKPPFLKGPVHSPLILWVSGIRREDILREVLYFWDSESMS
jgi:hypothetical protein